MISFFSLKEGFDLKDPEIYRQWLIEVIQEEKCLTGELSYVFCSDDYLLNINKKYLNHHYFTDIITFPASNKEEVISGEIYISVDRVTDNAKTNRVSFENELARVIVHGVLHLIGYDDHSPEEKVQMRSKEDYYLILLSEKQQ